MCAQNLELQERLQNLNCVVIGSQAVGKTSLLNALVSGPNSEAEPFQRFNGIKIEFGADNGKVYQLTLWDTNSPDHQSMIRKIYYEKCDIILICFSVTDHDSFKDIKRKWLPEIKKCCPQIPFIIVANKIDLRNDRVSLLRLDRLQNLKPIETMDGRNLSRSLSSGYVECSASMGDGLRNLFDEVIKIYLNPPQRNDCLQCNIL